LTNLHLLPTLPFDIIPESSVCKLPVKLLLQLRCICKLWNTLISDLKFANKHLHMSKTLQHNHHLIVNTSSTLCNLILKDCQITSIFSARSTSVVRKTKLSFPDILKNVSANHLHVCSCDGILCFSTEVGTLAGHSVVLWNPSIRKFNVFPPLENQDKGFFCCSFSFGYAHLTHTCKIVSVSFFHTEKITQVVAVASGSYIVSLDLEKESYQKILKPNVGTNHCTYLGS
jgi:hypothetical protein